MVLILAVSDPVRVGPRQHGVLLVLLGGHVEQVLWRRERRALPLRRRLAVVLLLCPSIYGVSHAGKPV